MPNVNKNLLVWARKEAGLSIDEAAQLLGLKDTETASAVDKLRDYESGKNPSHSLLNKMSKHYRRPIVTFYLNQPPKKTDRGEDFRSLPQTLDPKQNLLVDVLVRDIKARQGIIRQALIDEDEAEALPFIGKFSMEQSVLTVAEEIKKALAINLKDFRSQKNYDYAFKYLREKVEHSGVFVLLRGNIGSYHTDIDLSVFRGFALSDAIAPMIVINHLEAKSARGFTLLHELTHLFLDKTGISSSSLEKHVEQFCDRVASEILLPEHEFSSFQPDDSSFDSLQEDISFYAYDHRISCSQVAYRCWQADIIDKKRWKQLKDYFHKKFTEEKEKLKEDNRNKSGGPNLNIVRNNYLGELVHFVKRMNVSGAISATKAGIVLGVQPTKINKLFESNAT